jgi:peptide chain release factor subunit 1
LPEGPVDVAARLKELGKITGAPTPVVSVYLDTRWADEHQRERVRVFLKNEVARARRDRPGPALRSDLEWVEQEGEALIAQVRFPEADGVALFACAGLGLREVIPVRVPFDNAFVVAPAPFLGPLAALAATAPSAVVVFVDGESARLIPVAAGGAGEEARLESDVPGHHRRGGWAQLAQSRYERHIQEHRARHFEAVAEALAQLTEGNGIERIVLAGEPRTVAVFARALPPRLARRVVGSIPAARYESAPGLVARAESFLAHREAGLASTAVEAVLTEAAKGRQAVAGVEETLEAAARGAVQRLYVLKGWSLAGGLCPGCGALQRGEAPACRFCGGAVTPADLGVALVDRVIAAGGTVEQVEVHQELARVGGVAALLRYPL